MTVADGAGRGERPECAACTANRANGMPEDEIRRRHYDMKARFPDADRH